MTSPAVASAAARTAVRRPARLDPDTLPALVTAVLLTSTLGAVSFVLSYSGLVAVASWASVPHHLAWTVPVTIDASILVYTLAVFIFRARGERNSRVWTSLVLFTAVSVSANAAHAWDAGSGDWHGYAGAAIAGLAPVSVLLTTHTLAELIVASPPTRRAGVVHRVPVADVVPARAAVTPVPLPGVDPVVPTDLDVEQPSPVLSADPVETEPAPPAAPSREERAPELAPEPTPARAGVVRDEGRADQLHLVAAAARSGQEAAQMTDQAAITLIRRLDQESESGPVSRRTIEKAVGCGASRATRLTDLARSGPETRPQTAGLDRQTA